MAWQRAKSGYVGQNMRRAKIAPPPKNPGRPEGWKPDGEADHFLECPTCGHMIDMRDLAEVLEHAGPHQAPTRS